MNKEEGKVWQIGLIAGAEQVFFGGCLPPAVRPKREDKIMKKTLIVSGIVAMGLVFNASATITFSTGNQQYNNVNFAADQNAGTVTGLATIGGQDLQVYFTSGIGPDGSTPITLHAQHGVAFVENNADAASSTPQIGFSSITIKPQAGYGFTAGDFKLDEINSGVSGLVTFFGKDQFGNLTMQSFAISPNGQNPYQFVTSNGEMVTSLVFTVPTTSLMADVKQVSVDMAPMAIPEPATVVSAFLLVLPLGVSAYRIIRKNQTV